MGQIDVSKEISKFHYVMLFSEKEGLPLTLIEACMFGRPMLTNDISVAIEVNTDGQTGFVFNSIQSLAEGLKQLPLPGSEMYQSLSKNARERYENLFQEENMIKQYKKLILSF